jgi:hypothetical protein
MSDFSFTTYVSRDEIADELRGNEEDLAYVLGRLGNEVDISSVVDFVHGIEVGSDTARIAKFYRDFADLIETV